jgi:hypothetical protein
LQLDSDQNDHHPIFDRDPIQPLVGQMFAFVALFSSLSRSTLNLTSALIGKWEISTLPLEQDGSLGEATNFSTQLTSTPESSVTGEIIGEDADGVATPQYRLSFTPNSPVSFTVRFGPAGEGAPEELEEVATVEFQVGVDDLITATGTSADGSLFSVNVLSSTAIEVTLFNAESQVTTIFRCGKEVPAQKQSLWMSLMPMLPMLLMMFFRGGGMGQDPAAAQAGAAKQKED